MLAIVLLLKCGGCQFERMRLFGHQKMPSVQLGEILVQKLCPINQALNIHLDVAVVIINDRYCKYNYSNYMNYKQYSIPILVLTIHKGCNDGMEGLK